MNTSGNDNNKSNFKTATAQYYAEIADAENTKEMIALARKFLSEANTFNDTLGAWDIIKDTQSEECLQLAIEVFKKALPLMRTFDDFQELLRFQDELIGNAHVAEVCKAFLSMSLDPSDVLKVYEHLIRDGAHPKTILDIRQWEPLFALVFKKVNEFLEEKP